MKFSCSLHKSLFNFVLTSIANVFNMMACLIALCPFSPSALKFFHTFTGLHAIGFDTIASLIMAIGINLALSYPTQPVSYFDTVPAVCKLFESGKILYYEIQLTSRFSQ